MRSLIELVFLTVSHAVAEPPDLAPLGGAAAFESRLSRMAKIMCHRGNADGTTGWTAGLCI